MAAASRSWRTRLKVQVPSLRAAGGPFDPGRHDARVAWCDDALGLQPVQAGAHGPLRQPGLADQRGHRGERAGTVRPGVVGQAEEHELARGGRLSSPAGWDRARFSAQETASTLTARRS
jgi:hypothetical protein